MSGGASAARRARVRAFAKINLDLRVLAKRSDGYHELRTIFQTVSLADVIEIGFTPARRTVIELKDELGIPNNLVTRAAQSAMDAMRMTGRVEMRLQKQIPMGAGLGGGSSDAAAVLLALPVLAGRNLDLRKSCALAQDLGSDVPFFLLGGAAVGIGRGTELFPLPDTPPRPAVLIAPGVHVNTAEAYRALTPRLTRESEENKIVNFQSQTWDAGVGAAANDFEEVVFEQHPSLGVLRKRLLRAGAFAARMTGSGSAVFGLFDAAGEASRAAKLLRKDNAFQISFLSRAQYRANWRRALKEHTTGRIWPPPSRYAR